MSWDKNTIVLSEIDSVIKTLEVLKQPYKLETLGHFNGRGLNDDPMYNSLLNTTKVYTLRRLEYADQVILEYAEAHSDCDFNDYIQSQSFNKKDAPKNKDWELVKHIDDDETLAEEFPYPICPMNIYFEGDEDKCNQDKCDYDQETRSCSEACKR